MADGLIIRHVPYEGISGYRAPIEAAGYVLERIDVSDRDFASIDFLSPDLVMLMGGPMGVYERAEHPWIDCEIIRLAERIACGLPTLGVCLGAQMIAAAIGGEVVRGPAPEIGFGAVTLNAAGADSPLRHVADVPVLHWHGDTFALPEGVELLASTSACAHQAFRRGPNLLALQFHAEMGEDPRFEAWLDGCEESARPGLRTEHDELGPAAVAAGQAMIAEWLGQLA
jgi:GMP synthase (glutamine-hydrolysing)